MKPIAFADDDELEDFMTQPSDALVQDMADAPGDILVLGAGGKMGPTLARLAKRAAPDRRVIAVSRFGEAGQRDRLERTGVETVVADLLDRDAVEALPRTSNVVFMAGFKFGATGSEPLLWAMNVLAPAIVAETFVESRVVCFSTGCVYPFVDVAGAGAGEETPTIPPGEYANTCVGRERMFQFAGVTGRIVRLNYAIDLRYGVLHDVARKVLDGEPIDVTSGHVNVIWQGDANAIALRCLAHPTTPISPINVSGPETVSIRWLAAEFGRLLGRTPQIVGSEAATGWLTDTTRMQAEFGPPSVTLAQLIGWTAQWVSDGRASLGKPTHYEVRDGRF